HRAAQARGERRAVAVPLPPRRDAGVPLPIPVAGELGRVLGQPLHAAPRHEGLLPAAPPRPSRDHQGRQALLPRLSFARPMANEPLRHEKYTHGHAAATVRQHGRRTADEAAAFLLPLLQPGMRLLDVGCGPGSITRGLAQRLAPGEVVGLDLSRETLASAREDAAQRGLTNLTYVEGSVYQIPFPDASFDVAYAHQVTQHLRKPADALGRCCACCVPAGWSEFATSTGGRSPTGRSIRGSIASSRPTSRPGTRTAASHGWVAG